jgi:hypothetical protein
MGTRLSYGAFFSISGSTTTARFAAVRSSCCAWSRSSWAYSRRSSLAFSFATVSASLATWADLARRVSGVSFIGAHVALGPYYQSSPVRRGTKL